MLLADRPALRRHLCAVHVRGAHFAMTRLLNTSRCSPTASDKTALRFNE